MAKIKVNNVQLHYEVSGSGPEVMVFSHGYLMDHSMFDRQIEAFKDRFRCIAFDHRGHGKSEVTKDGYEMDNLVKDAIELIEGLALGPVHFVGLSTGGFVGMRIALRRPDLLKSLILMDTSAEEEDAKALKLYNLLLWIVHNIGWFPVRGQIMSKLFHRTFLKDKSQQAEVRKWWSIVTGHSKKGLLPFGRGIFGRDRILEKLSSIDLPSAVLVGEFDQATPPAINKRMAEAIPGAAFFTIPDAGHSITVEQAEEVTKAMEKFYSLHGIGETVRR